MRPTIHLSNWSSHRTPGAHGSGRKFSIMARPRAWEWGDGRVEPLATMGDLEPMMIEALTERAAGIVEGDAMQSYRMVYLRRIGALDMRPGYLVASHGGSDARTVIDGTTLCCGCAVDYARKGLCHRAWLAEAFARDGWRVVLDGREWAPTPSAAP